MENIGRIISSRDADKLFRLLELAERNSYIYYISEKESNYLFIGSKDFRYSNNCSFKKIFVLGKDSFDSLEKNQEFIKYREKYGRDHIDILPSSLEMYTNIQLKKEAWDKLKRIVNY